MEKRLDLTEGPITSTLIKLSLPIMGTSFIQMAYNLIDMMWVGKLGSNAVAAVGTAGFYPWLAMALIVISRIGGEIKVAQSIGEKNISLTKSYIQSAIEINLISSLSYMLFLFLLNNQLIAIFNLGDNEVIKLSQDYLYIIAVGMIAYFINPVFTSIFNGLGDSKTPFKINTIGLVTNIVLDPLLIFGVGPIPKLGVSGAAIATVVAQVVVTICFLFIIFKSKNDYFKIRLFKNINFSCYKELYKLGIPVALQNGLFTLFSMAIGIIVASFGPVAIAVQKVGSQIESISWMSADGFAVALSSFVGQNYGAQKIDRINKGCKAGFIIAFIWGIITTIILVFAGEAIFKLFIDETEAITQGGVYLKILGYSQLFMCIEIITSGAFKGLGRTAIPSFISIILTGARIPMAYLLSKPSLLGLDGIWWSVSLSSVFKGIFLISIFVFLYKSKKLYKDLHSETTVVSE